MLWTLRLIQEPNQFLEQFQGWNLSWIKGGNFGGLKFYVLKSTLNNGRQKSSGSNWNFKYLGRYLGLLTNYLLKINFVFLILTSSKNN